jgi:OOP family OmpA-OmpF porin
VFGGYQFNQNWAAEMIYAKFGKFSLHHTITGGTAVDRAKPDALCLAGVGTLPLSGKWSVLGKAGVCHWNDHASDTESVTEIVEESSGTDPMFGLGASYSMTKQVDIRGEWERYQNVVHNRGDVNLFSVSLSYRF